MAQQVWRRLSPFGGNYVAPAHPLAQRLRQISAAERREEAQAFLRQFAQETGQGEAVFRARWAEVRASLRRTGTYDHTGSELAFGARVAWRNHGRCIGRLFWESLEVFDCRHIGDPDGIAERVSRHMADALGDGRIRSMISVFAPVRPGQPLPPYIESGQITQYAGYADADGSVLGDRQSVDATRVAQSLGWVPPAPKGRFDLIPYVIRDGQDRRTIHALPDAAFREIPIAHPVFPGLSALGLRWYAVPCISGMILTIGGVDYPCAPFNGFYMGTEIASRDFADRKRYDLLAGVACAIGLDPAAPGPELWRDTALTELNRAVLHSFRAAGVTMVDHHTASAQFMEFHQREQVAGRRVAADWRWIVPPQAAAATDVFHLKMRNFHPVPNFYSSRAGDGMRLMPWYGDVLQSRQARWHDRVMRRWKLWKRIAW